MTYAIRSGTFAVRNSSVRTVFEGVVDIGYVHVEPVHHRRLALGR